MAGARVGVVGWKTHADPTRMDAPSYLVDELRGWSAVAARSRTPRTCSSMPADGLRVINEVEQLAAMEAASCVTSGGVRRLLTGLTPG